MVNNGINQINKTPYKVGNFQIIIITKIGKIIIIINHQIIQGINKINFIIKIIIFSNKNKTNSNSKTKDKIKIYSNINNLILLKNSNFKIHKIIIIEVIADHLNKIK